MFVSIQTSSNKELKKRWKRFLTNFFFFLKKIHFPSLNRGLWFKHVFYNLSLRYIFHIRFVWHFKKKNRIRKNQNSDSILLIQHVYKNRLDDFWTIIFQSRNEKYKTFFVCSFVCIETNLSLIINQTLFSRVKSGMIN